MQQVDGQNIQKYHDIGDEIVLLYVKRPTKHENTTLLTGLSVASEEMSAPNILILVRKYNLDASISRLLTWKSPQLTKTVFLLYVQHTELCNATIHAKKVVIVSEELSAQYIDILET